MNLLDLERFSVNFQIGVPLKMGKCNSELFLICLNAKLLFIDYCIFVHPFPTQPAASILPSTTLTHPPTR